jgi:hypothetical protein
MNKFTTIIIMCFIFTASCINEPNNSVIIINPERFIKSEITISEIAESVQYIPLSPTPSINFIIELQIADDHIFLVSGGGNKGEIYKFDLKGNFIRTIGKAGRGPGEYRYGFMFTIDRENEKVFVLDKPKILTYSFSGEFLSDFLLPDTEPDFDAIRYFNNKLFLFENIKYGKAKYNWVVLDAKGNVESFKKNNIPSFKSINAFMDKTITESGGGINYWNKFNDTIFSVDSEGYTAKYLFSEGDYRVTPEVVDNEKYFFANCFRPQNILESENHLIIKYFMAGREGYAVFNKKEKQFKSIEYDLLEKKSKGFINDIDEGLPINPFDYYLKDRSEYIVSWFNAYELKAHVESDAFRNSIPKNPDKKKELERLANRLSENDNPVLMLVKLKK